MNVALKNKSLQKGASRTIVIVGVVIAVVVLGGILLGLNGSNKRTPVNNQQTISNQQNQPSSEFQFVGETELDKVENKSYIFYYPKGYIKDDLDKDNVLRYKNPNTNRAEIENIVLSVLGPPSPERKPSSRNLPTYQFCEKLSETLRRTGEDEMKAEVTAGLGGKGVGCKTVAKTKVANDIIVNIAKSLWYDKGEDYSIYKVRTTYLSNA